MNKQINWKILLKKAQLVIYIESEQKINIYQKYKEGQEVKVNPL